MKFSLSPRTALLRALKSAALPLFCGLSLAQTIPNPSFEADTFTSFPGYASGNGGAITGWTSTKLASVGLNPSAGTPFADNGAIPAGVNVAFLQSTAGGTDLGTTITGLTAGSTYRISFRANARGENSPNLKVSLDSVPALFSLDFAMPATSATVTSVNSLNPYHLVELTYAATDGDVVLGILNDAAGDNTLVLDDFKIELASNPLPPAITASRWTGDADSGVDSAFRYTFAKSFGGSPASSSVNGVLFTPAFGGNPGAANVFSTTDYPAAFGDQGRNISGASNTVAKSFVYGGPATSLTFNGLKASTTYVATLYGVGWETGDRSADFSTSAGGGPVNVNLDAFNATNGIGVRCRFTTDASGTAVTVNLPQAATAVGSWHLAAASCREALPGTTTNTWSVHPWTGDATSGINDGASYNYTHAYNFGSAAGPVVNGITFTGLGGANPSNAQLALANFSGVFVGDTNTLTAAGGGSAGLATDFIYNGFPGFIRLNGLTPGTEYHLSLFSVGWDDSGRNISFQSYSQTTGSDWDQDIYGNDAGVRFSYVYTAPASGSITVTTNPLTNGSFHLYGIANRKTTPETALGVLSHPQPVTVTVLGQAASFTASASGNPPLTYEWRKNGVAIPGESGTTTLSATLNIAAVAAGDAGEYSCAFTGSGQGTVVTNAAKLTIITDRVPGLFSTGVGRNCVVLADGQPDPHYVLAVNADGAPLASTMVHDGNVFPIVAGPWIANSATSKWISPRVDSGGAAGGDYTYRTTFDLTGFDLASVRITGTWATDNGGVDILVNGTSVGIANTSQFVALSAFQLTSANASFSAGVNTLEFRVNNADPVAGYTGLRVDGLQGFGKVLPATPPHIALAPANTSIAWQSTGCLTVGASGTATLAYQWKFNGTDIPGANADSLVILADDCAKVGNYSVTVSNGFGNVTSSSAAVTFTGAPPCPGNATMSLAPGTSGKLLLSAVAALGSGGAGPLDIPIVQSAPTTGGGTVTVQDGYMIYEPAPGFIGADAFSYILSDGTQFAAGSVAVVVANGIGQTVNIIGMVPAGAGKNVTAVGIPGRSYQWQSSENLTSWTNLGPPATCPASGVLNVNDPGPLPPARYYRMVQPQ